MSALTIEFAGSRYRIGGAPDVSTLTGGRAVWMQAAAASTGKENEIQRRNMGL